MGGSHERKEGWMVGGKGVGGRGERGGGREGEGEREGGVEREGEEEVYK